MRHLALAVMVFATCSSVTLRAQDASVFVRRDGRWWIEAYHNVDVKPGR
jgi:hypothetical protein